MSNINYIARDIPPIVMALKAIEQRIAREEAAKKKAAARKKQKRGARNGNRA